MTKPLALIIEDSPVFNKMFSLTLQSEFEVEIIEDGEDAIARLRDLVPDLIVLDLNLPNVSGKDILTRVKADVRFENTRVILATGDERQAEALDDLADIVLLKPINPNQLRDLASRMKSKQ